MVARESLYGTAKDLGYRMAVPRWNRLRIDAGGMLSPLVYRRMYRAVRRLPDLDIVEVGGAAGAGSVAIAWAMRDAGLRAKLIAVEKCEGGSRARFGDYDANYQRIIDNLERFGVRDRVILFPHKLSLENGPEVLGLCETSELAAFVHDADGRLDRDVQLFWPRLRPGGLVIVDDDDPRPHYRVGDESNPDGGMKGVLTHRLLIQLEEWGLFERTGKVRNTTFGRKPVDARMDRFDPTVCEAILASVRREREEFLAASSVAGAT
jgi:predicted O-methyltransferase YrrM